MDRESTENTETKDRSEQERSEQEGEDETNVDDDRRRMNESIPVPDGSNRDFKRVDADTDTSEGPGGSVPNVGCDVGTMKRSVTDDKKRFLKDKLKVSVNKGDGPSSTKLYDKLRITSEKSGKINGAMYDGKKVLILKNGKMEYSTDKRNAQHVSDFKDLLMKVHKEHQKTSAAQVKEQLKAQGLDASEEHVDSIQEGTGETIGERISELGDEVLNNPDITGNERRELEGIFSFDEYRELGGTAKEESLEQA